MRLDGNTVLITGGTGRIGFALAIEFIKADNRVIICGRRRDQLERIRRERPEISTIECDVSSEAGRLSLFSRITKKFSSFNVLINNAGVRFEPPPLTAAQDWQQHHLEIATNLEAPLHLSMLFIPHLAQQRASAIINFSSCYAHSPIADRPTYCATKAGLSSFTASMRDQLAHTSISVIDTLLPEKVPDAERFARYFIAEIGNGRHTVAF